MTIFGISMRNAFKKSTHMPGIGSLIREMAVKMSEMSTMLFGNGRVQSTNVFKRSQFQGLFCLICFYFSSWFYCFVEYLTDYCSLYFYFITFCFLLYHVLFFLHHVLFFLYHVLFLLHHVLLFSLSRFAFYFITFCSLLYHVLLFTLSRFALYLITFCFLLYYVLHFYFYFVKPMGALKV